MYTVSFDFSDIDGLSTLKCNLPLEPDSITGKAQIVQTLSRLHHQFNDDKVPKLSSVQMGVDDAQLVKIERQLSNLQEQLNENVLSS